MHREAPLQDLCDQLGVAGYAQEGRALTAGIEVNFAGEVGQDEGGLWREYLPMALLHLLDNRKGLFVEAEEEREAWPGTVVDMTVPALPSRRPPALARASQPWRAWS